MKYLKYVIGFLISAVALWFALKGLDFAQVGAAFAKVNYGILALSMVPFGIVMFQKALRHKTLFWPLQGVSFHNIFAALMMSYLFNTILPARLGEVVRAYAITRNQKIPIGRTFSTVLLEKILDVIALFVFFLGLLVTHRIPIDPTIESAAIAISSIVIAGFGAALLMAWQRKFAERFIRFALQPIPAKFGDRLYHLTEQVLDSLEVLIHWRISLWIWVQSIGIWATTALTYLLWGYAINLPPAFGLSMAVLVMFTSNLSMAIPGTPGNIGTLEAATIGTLLPFFPDQRGLITSYAFLTHIAGFLPLVIVGTVYALREGVSLGEAQRESKAVHAEADAMNDAVSLPRTDEPHAPKPRIAGVVTASADASVDEVLPRVQPRPDAGR